MPMSTKRKAPTKVAAPFVKPSAQPTSRNRTDESRTSVAVSSTLPSVSGGIEDASSEDESDDEELSNEVEGRNEPAVNGHKQSSQNGISNPLANGNKPSHLPSPNQSQPIDAEEEGDDAEPTSPSFGELLRGSETIDVPALLLQPSTETDSLRPNRAPITPPALQSLTTVLTQALRTEDTDLLESCLHTNDLTTIKNTIERLDSMLAGTLLNSLAARLYRKPGRAGNLMTWVQWTLISHGGALASQPKVVQSLASLQKVLAERAKGLTSLLALKGKLDLLEGQMVLRKTMQSRGSAALKDADNEEDDEVIWVEGEDLESNKIGRLANGTGPRRKAQSEGEDSDDGLVLNGVLPDSDEEEDDSADGEDDSEAAEESLDEGEVDYDDVDDSMGEEEDSDVDAGPPSKVQKMR